MLHCSLASCSGFSVAPVSVIVVNVCVCVCVCEGGGTRRYALNINDHFHSLFSPNSVANVNFFVSVGPRPLTTEVSLLVTLIVSDLGFKYSGTVKVFILKQQGQRTIDSSRKQETERNLFRFCGTGAHPASYPMGTRGSFPGS
jgi:hypothetical protein